MDHCESSEDGLKNVTFREDFLGVEVTRDKYLLGSEIDDATFGLSGERVMIWPLLEQGS